MKKLTSYQKLKAEIKKLNKEKGRLTRIIAEDDWLGAEQVRGEYSLSKDMENAVMFGEREVVLPKPPNTESLVRERYDKIINVIECIYGKI